jgi:hypothetical protein
VTVSVVTDSTCEGIPGCTSRDVLRARALLSAGVATVDRVLGLSDNSDADPEVTMALTETSQATHRALVKLKEVTEMLAEVCEDDPSHRQIYQHLTAHALHRLEAS